MKKCQSFAFGENKLNTYIFIQAEYYEHLYNVYFLEPTHRRFSSESSNCRNSNVKLQHTETIFFLPKFPSVFS